MKTILITGASGFIGNAFIEALVKDPEVRIVGLSRRDRASTHPQVEWRKCDLYSLKDIKESMLGCDTAYYLVHSMAPSAGLTQGEFYDFDLLMADNFVRAAQHSGLKRIIYLGGLIPHDQEELSWHLKSRLEVEQTLRTAPCEVIALRAGLILGKNGSSFVILQNLVERLRFMVLPSWTKSKSEPIALEDVIRILLRCLSQPIAEGHSFDIGGTEKLTYRDLILRTAKIFHKKITVFYWDLISVRLSRFWVALVSGVPKTLVYPLVLSLKHDMLVNPRYAWPHPGDIRIPMDQALREALASTPVTPIIHYSPPEKDVRSVQRLTFPLTKSAEWVAEEYFRWLPQFGRPFFRVIRNGNWLSMRFLGLPKDLLVLERSEERSSPDRQLLYIRGGMLTKNIGRGRLEFREVLEKKYIMAAIHEFRPSLPWFLYRYTQAIVHLWVMKAFERHLARLR
jgi:uncharacterized protein YbjT (DUF2867 family)